MPTGTLGSSARDYPARSNQLGAVLTFANFGGVGAGMKLGTIPAGCCAVRAYTGISTAFDGTTPTIKIGTAAGGAQLVAAGSLAAGMNVLTVISVGPFAADQDIYISNAVTGSPTTGAGFVVLEFVNPLAA